MTLLASTSTSHRDVIHANGQDGSTNTWTWGLLVSSMEDSIPAVEDNRDADWVGTIVHRWQEVRPDLDPTPMFVIGRIQRLATLLDAELRPPFAAAGLAAGDFDLLAALRRQDPPHEATPGHLADVMLVTSGGTTKRIDRLERQGLVRRRPSTHDGRSNVVTLTAAGRRLTDELIGAHLANEARLLDPLTAAQRHALAQLLEALSISVEDAVHA
jgi:DNA-binding MarR family transcriptional regulator